MKNAGPSRSLINHLTRNGWGRETTRISNELQNTTTQGIKETKKQGTPVESKYTIKQREKRPIDRLFFKVRMRNKPDHG